jgi:hypothetical protein
MLESDEPILVPVPSRSVAESTGFAGDDDHIAKHGPAR